MDSGRKPSKWGPSGGGGGGDKGPKSLMDMNFSNRGPNPGNFRPPPRGPSNQNAPWMNQNRPYGPRGGGGPPGNAPWMQNRGKKIAFFYLIFKNKICFYFYLNLIVVEYTHVNFNLLY